MISVALPLILIMTNVTIVVKIFHTNFPTDKRNRKLTPSLKCIIEFEYMVHLTIVCPANSLGTIEAPRL